MRKRIVLLMGMILVFASIVVSASIIFSPGKIPFPYEPNQIVGKKLGGVSIEATDFMIVDINCTDPQDDPFVITIVDAPPGVYIINDANDWRLQWTPEITQVGIWYVVLKATDSPSPPRKSKSSQGTIVIQVVTVNEAPVLWPLEDSPVITYIWPGDYQKRWQELRKQRTILLGSVGKERLL